MLTIHADIINSDLLALVIKRRGINRMRVGRGLVEGHMVLGAAVVSNRVCTWLITKCIILCLS